MKKLIIIIFLFIIYSYIANITLIPKNIILFEDEKLNLKSMYGIDFVEISKTLNENRNISNIEIRLLGKINLREITVNRLENIEVVPVGKIIGLKLYTNGVLVVGKTEIEDSKLNKVKPYEVSNVKEGDSILEINNEKVENIETLKKIVNNSNGENLKITLLRSGDLITTNILPVKTSKNEYKLGLWVKDAATGVGTISFYEPKNNGFAVLGHGITDVDTGELIDVDYGELVTSKVISIKKGEISNPGEVRGTIINQMKIGEVSKNTNFGVYGTLDNLTSLNIDTTKTMKVAKRDEIESGNAKILCSVDNSNNVKEYDIFIEKIYKDNDFNNKSMLIKVIDEELINKTGGIIRGLSGAPIIQNGKFIGAITNVLVSNPEIGYGIFGDLMIKEMNR